jgi:hypothetical protein
MRLRNTLPLLLALALGSAWAIDPLVGPGKVGEKDPKGGVKGADAGAGPHLGFTEQYERRVDRPEQAVEKEQKEKAGKAKKDEKTASKPKN